MDFWGHDVWTAASPERSGDTLHAYLKRVFNEEPGDDVWGFIRGVRPNDAELTEAEFKGYASVLLAGGRDTVIKLITGLVWHLLNTPEDLEALKSDASLERPLINELLRFLSPLPAIERVRADESGEEPSTYYRLHFASANHDQTVWEQPDRIDIYRGRQPHMAFGYGPHACIGMNLAEYEAKAFLSKFASMPVMPKLTGFNLEWDEIEGIRFLSDLKNVSIRFGS